MSSVCYPFDVVLVPSVMGHGLPWAPDRVVVIPGESGPRGGVLGHDTKGRTYSLVTLYQMTRGGAGAFSHRALAVQDVGSWLAEYFARPEPGFVTEDGKPCGPDTRGRLVPAPLRVVGRIVGGSEDIRWRKDEPSSAWGLHRRQEAIAATRSEPRSCAAPGCGVGVVGRRRWCERHARMSGTWRKRRGAQAASQCCACGCGLPIPPGSRADRRYLDQAHRKRAARVGGAM